MFRPTDDVEQPGRPRRQLGHLDSQRDSGFDHWKYYTLHPLAVDRPATGHTRVAFTCASCGGSVDVTVYSLPELRRLRVRALALGLGEFAAAGAVGYGSALAVATDSGWWMAAGFLGFFAAFALLVTGVVTALQTFVEDGARLGPSGGIHQLREPGHDSDYRSTEPAGI